MDGDRTTQARGLAEEFAEHMRELIRVSLAHTGAEDPREAFKTPEVMAFVDWAYACRDRIEAFLRTPDDAGGDSGEGEARMRQRCARVASDERSWRPFWDGQPIQHAIAAAIRALPLTDPSGAPSGAPNLPPTSGDSHGR